MTNFEKQLFIFLLICLVPFQLFAKSDIDVIHQRVIVELMKPEVDDAEVELLINTINDDGTWPGVDYKDVSREGFEHRYHHSNMVALARAYKTQSSEFYKKKKVKETIELALKNWVEHDYFCDNWWHNQIGTPNNMVTLMLLVGDELDDNLVEKAQPIIGRAHSEAPGARPGGDRIKICGIQAKNCLFLGDDEKFNEVVRIIESEIKYSEWVGAKYGYTFRYIPTGFSNRKMGGRGIMYDNSFHHRVDGVNNTLSYGLGYAAAFAEWAVYTSETKYAFSQEQLAKLVDYFLDGICKTAVYGKYPDVGAKNRSISREGALKPYNSSLPEKLLKTTDYRKDELQEIVDIRKVNAKPTSSHATFYWDSEHFTYQRPDFFTSVRMYSTRNYNMEKPYNSEGLFNHYRGDGVNHISRTGDEYYDIAPVYDYQKIPGATIMQRPEMLPPDQIQKLGLTDFVGAATDGDYAAVGFDFKSPHDPLIARKAWFFFDDAYVCLGAGISSRKELPVFTTLNQCLLRDDVSISQANKISVLEKGEKSIEDVDWVFQDGIGYVFPKPTTVSIMNSQETGSWWRINKQSDSPKDEFKLDVFKLWMDHGKAPSDATYEYIIVPATSEEVLKKNTSKDAMSIISNTPELQAVYHNGLKMVQAVFYKAGELQVSNGVSIYSDNPGIVLLKFNEQTLQEITVSDPGRELGKYHLSISQKVEEQGENFTSIWDENKKLSDISIELPHGVYTGKSISIRF